MPNKKKTTYIILTFDTDSDPKSDLDQSNKKPLGWYGLKGINSIRKKINILEKKLKIKIPLTWFIRCDDQIKFYKKNSDWILKKYNKFWKNELKKGSELQWHAHLYKKTNGKWIQKTNPKDLKKELRDNLNKLKKYFVPSCVRIGEAYMSTSLMKIIKDLKIMADSSAIPGRKRNDKEKYFDWSKTPNNPYFPSDKNYQLNSKQKKNKLIELPMNTIPIKTSYDKVYLKRYVNLSFWPKLFGNNLKNFLDKNTFLISVTHPYEIVDEFGNNKNNKLISFKISSLTKNIEKIISMSNELNLNLKFITINDLINKIKINENKKINSI